jgi:hypothetical protein
MSQISCNSSIDIKVSEMSNDSFKSQIDHSPSCSLKSSEKYRIRVKMKEIERENLLQELEAKNSALKKRVELIDAVIIRMVDFLMTNDNI